MSCLVFWKVTEVENWNDPADRNFFLVVRQETARQTHAFHEQTLLIALSNLYATKIKHRVHVCHVHFV